jgi:hypothetical protein
LDVISSGDVGIGTDSPSNTNSFNKVLDVRGTNHSKVLATSNNATIKTGIFAHTTWQGGAGFVGTESNHGIHLVTNLTPQLTILPNGNVGIGYTTPTVKLHIEGSIRGNQTANALKIQTSQGWTTIGAQYSNYSHFYTDRSKFYFSKGLRINEGIIGSHAEDLQLQTGGTTRVWVDYTTGRVGINENDPSYTLDVEGDIYTSGLYRGSDERLKKDIEQKINNIFKLQAKTYIWDLPIIERIEPTQSLGDTATITDVVNTIHIDTTPKIGFIAQEVIEYFPNLVREDDEGYYSIDYLSLIPVLVEVLKEQQAQISDLQSELEGLKSETKLKSTSSDLYNEHTLFQNSPNPFRESTEISYYVSTDVEQAYINIYDLNGSQLRSFQLLQKENGKITIQGNELSQGMYMYTLIVDGEVIDTKRMILTD